MVKLKEIRAFTEKIKALPAIESVAIVHQNDA
jgi:hypothetical protein